MAKMMKFVQERLENIVVTSIISFSQNVFKRLLPHYREKLRLYGKG